MLYRVRNAASPELRHPRRTTGAIGIAAETAANGRIKR
jgi:hypothetical protein